MLGYLIYESEEAEKNRTFIELFEKEGKKQGITFECIAPEQVEEASFPDFVLNRTRNANISKWYEDRGVKVFHNEMLTRIGNHKYDTLKYLRNRLPKEILKKDWAPESIYITADILEESMKQWDWRAYIVNAVKGAGNVLFQGTLSMEKDWVIKTVDGHGGNEVSLLENGWSEDCLKQKLVPFCGKDCILQERVQSDSKDVRVYIVGGMIYEAMLRCGADDFRSNYSLGGTAQVYSLSEEERSHIERFIHCFPKNTLGMVGMDFILTKEGRLVFNELEEMVGSRMLYRYTEHDIVKDYVAWLTKVNLL